MAYVDPDTGFGSTAASPPIGAVGLGGLAWVHGPTALQHENRLRGTGTGRTHNVRRNSPAYVNRAGNAYKARWNEYKIANPRADKLCGSFCMYAYIVAPEADGKCYLGIQFRDGTRRYFPDTVSDLPDNPSYNEIVNAESGSYYWWDRWGHPFAIGADPRRGIPF